MSRWTISDALKVPAIRTAVRTADMEQGSIDEPAGADAIKEVHQRAHIDVHCYRVRPADLDNICAKWCTDALVKAGVIKDDSPDYVDQFLFRETKVKSYSEEKTEITVTFHD